MKTQIVVHLLPHELDYFEWQTKQFKIGSDYIDKNDKIIIDVTLNLNLVNWEESKLSKEFFIDKFNQIKLIWDWCESNFIIDEENKCLGCDDKRREAIRNTVADNILYLDSDLIFSHELLYYSIELSKQIEEEYYILSPQIVKMWDNTWDSITNDLYVKNKPDLQHYYNSNPFEILTKSFDEFSLKKVPNFKFGGGWFNLLSTKLLKLTDIPDSFGPYGVDDLYVMLCCNILSNKGYKIQQYIIENKIVTENYKYRFNPYIKYLKIIDLKEKYRNTASENLQLELIKFQNRI